MCGRYYVASEDSAAELQQIIDTLQRRLGADAVKLGEVHPSDQAAVIANNKSKDARAFAMRWGYSFPNSRPIINARSETALTKPLFRDGMLQRRRLVPASYYFGWEHVDGKSFKYAIQPANTKVIYMAGIYHMEHDVPTFTILTHEVAPDIAFIHDRMPVLLPSEVKSDWLNLGYKADEVIQSAQLNMAYRRA